MDFVFNEDVWMEPIETRIGDGPTVRTACPELSLAWKLLWLESDAYPQGKDLYDAVLLAERIRPNPELWKWACDTCRLQNNCPPNSSGGEWVVEWEEFHKEYPWIGDTDELPRRLDRALARATQEPQVDARDPMYFGKPVESRSPVAAPGSDGREPMIATS